MRFLDIWKKRRKRSHKGQHGIVIVIGGSEQYPGAVALAGIAALRSGADIVYVLAPEKVAWVVNCLYPDIITVKLPGKNFQKKHVKTCLAYAAKSDVVLIGNGMIGMDSFLKNFLREVKKPLVLDAGALQEWLDVKHAVLTPHRNEFRRLTGKKLTGNIHADLNIIKSVCKDNVIILKGSVDIIASGEKCVLNRGGNPGMTKGGTGDVLAGLCAGLLAQGMEIFEAAQLASSINKSIGDKRAKSYGYSYLASELADDIKKIKKKQP